MSRHLCEMPKRRNMEMVKRAEEGDCAMIVPRGNGPRNWSDSVVRQRLIISAGLRAMSKAIARKVWRETVYEKAR